MLRAPINKIIDMSLVDGPGNRTTIFFQGCNFDCMYCHNPETKNICINCGECIDRCPNQALKMYQDKVIWNEELCINCGNCYLTCKYNSSPKVKYMTTDEIIKVVKKNKPFIKGITISGGECTLYRDFIVELFQKVKKMGLETLIDTNGSLPIFKDKELMELSDGIMLDVKGADHLEHEKVVGKNNKVVLTNLKKLGELRKLIEIRTVIYNENENGKKTVELVSEYSEIYDFTNVTYRLIRFRPNGVKGVAKDWSSPSYEFMEELKKIPSIKRFNKVIIT